jgi:hypothetical protein
MRLQVTLITSKNIPPIESLVNSSLSPRLITSLTFCDKLTPEASDCVDEQILFEAETSVEKLYVAADTLHGNDNHGVQ